MITKERFIQIINRLENYNKLQEKINRVFDECIDNKENDFCNAGSICIGHESVVVELLENMFNTDMISYWIYELDYGKEYKDGYVQDGEGNNIDISTAEKLYDYLIKEAEGQNLLEQKLEQFLSKKNKRELEQIVFNVYKTICIKIEKLLEEKQEYNNLKMNKMEEEVEKEIQKYMLVLKTIESNLENQEEIYV